MDEETLKLAQKQIQEAFSALFTEQEEMAAEQSEPSKTYASGQREMTKAILKCRRPESFSFSEFVNIWPQEILPRTKEQLTSWFGQIDIMYKNNPNAQIMVEKIDGVKRYSWNG